MENAYSRKQRSCNDDDRALTEDKSRNEALLMNTLAIEIAGVNDLCFQQLRDSVGSVANLKRV